MLKLSGYKILRKIKESSLNVIYSALRDADQLPVVLKSLRSEHPSADQVALLFHELAISKDLNLPGIIRVYDLVEQQNTYALVKEDVRGTSLADFLEQKPIKNLATFFKLASQMVDILGELHQKHIIHKDIKPSNFIIIPETLSIKLTDLNYATRLQHEVQDIIPPERLEGTLAYMAPEQSGRMNRNIDYRSDFYALGVSLFEMLTGSLPFSYSDPLELLHAHLANEPPNPSDLNPAVPEMLSAIVLKLLSKSPVNRYQSSLGLKADLQRCLQEWNTNKKISKFSLGGDDVVDRLNISQTLYGRKAETETLLEAYQKVCEGKVDSLMVCGYSGIGKTMLINEVHKPMVQHKGYFIQGKFDQLQRNTPYTAITQALNQFVRLILAEPEARYDSLKADMVKALGDIGQVIVNLAPDLEMIVGKQPPLETLDPRDAERRLRGVFIRFLRAIANENHPLVMFIDDLQWIDSGSLKLFEFILTSDELSHILLIGAYRDNEVDKTHPLIHLFNTLKDVKREPKVLKISRLNTEHFTALLSDSLKLPKEETQQLATLIHKRTDGNPFFAKQVIGTIYHNQLLHFDQDRKGWVWDYEKIHALSITDNVVELMVSKFEQLPQTTTNLLKLASCVGNRFTLDILTVISKQTSEALGEALWPALQQELLFTLRLGYKRVEALSHEQLSILLSKDITYQFAHDRVQQAVYHTLDEKERQETHLAIAKLIMEKDPEAANNERLFEVTDHFNQAHSLLGKEEVLMVAELNYKAGVKAGAANAYQSMQNYLKAAIDLSNDSWWEKHHDFRYKLELEYINSCYLLGLRGEMGSLVHSLYEKCDNTVEELQLDRIQVLNYGAENKLNDAWRVLVRAFKRVNYRLPLNPTKLNVIWLMIQLKWKLRNVDLDSIENTIKMAGGEEHKIIQNIIASSITIAYTSGPLYFASLAFVGLLHLLKYGFGEGSGVLFIMYGALKGMRAKNIEEIKQGLRLREIGHALIDKYSGDYLRSWSLTLHTYGYLHMKMHIKDLFPIIKNAIELSFNTGNYESLTASSAPCTMAVLFFSGESTEYVFKRVKEILALHRKIKFKSIEPFIKTAIEVFEGLKDNKMTEISILDQPVETRTKTVDLGCDVSLVIYYFFFEKIEKVIYQFERNYNIHLAIKSSIFYETCCLLTAICLAKKIPETPFLKKFKYIRYFREIKNHFYISSQIISINYQLCYDIVCGVEERLKGNHIEAVKHFEQAINSAIKGGFTLWTAVANELTGEEFLSLGLEPQAREYIVEAHYYYQKYMMTPKVEILEKRYPEYFAELSEIEDSSKSLAESRISTGTTTSAGLDFMSVIKASQTIAGEIVLSKFFEKMLTIAIENAGAQRAVFIEKQKHAWYLIAETVVSSGTKRFREMQIPLEEAESVSKNIVQYAIRTQEPVIIKNALKDPMFSKDSYVLEKKPKSILCVPIIHHDDLVGVIYLENNLAINTFTKERVTVLRTLSAQVAISLENSRYIDKMQRLFTKAEKFVPKPFLELLRKQNIEEIELGDSEKIEITILYNDIRSFTTIVENRSPDDAFALVNRYWQFVAPVIRKHNGYIDHYQGDAILAIFPARPDDAVLASMEMMDKLKDFNKRQLEIGDIEIQMGIGISTGSAMLGIIGEDERHVSGLISDSANTAARVEGLNKYYQTRILLGDEAYNKLKSKEAFSTRHIDKVRLVGKKQVTNIYEVIEWEDQLKDITLDEYLKIFDEAFGFYEAGEFEKATKRLEHCLTSHPNDQVVKLLLERITILKKTVTPKEWDGVFELKYK